MFRLMPRALPSFGDVSFHRLRRRARYQGTGCDSTPTLSFSLPVLDPLVARAGCGLEADPIDDGDVPSVVVDQLALLESVRGFGNPDPAHAQHMSEKFMGKAKMICAYPVACHQQPAREARFNDVKTVASGGLRNLGHQRVGIEKCLLLQR